MFRFIKGLLTSDRSPRRAFPTAARAALHVESLDRRDLPSITMVGSVITIVGDNSNDVVTVNHNTLYDEIVVTRKYGSNKIEQKSFLANPIDFGIGTVPKTPTKITCNLKNGTNSFTNNTNLPSEVTGGTGKDTMVGGPKQDIFKGNGGNDTLYGGDGPDRLYGGSGNDLMDGNSGDDWLYGNAGFDVLRGGPGVDGLHGGVDNAIDILDGNGSSDRFLIHEGSPDLILGYDDDVDVKVYFENTTSSVTSNGSKYTKASWTDADIERVDRGLAAIHEKTGCNLMLKHDAWVFDDDYLHFRRAGARVYGKAFGGWNDGLGTITMTNDGMGSDNWAALTTIHEIGHEWDEEYGDDHGWLGLSGWTDDNPRSASYVKADNGYGDDWWYLKSADFVSTYAKSDPHEDFADSFAAYFLHEIGRDFTTSKWFGWANAPAKMEWMGDFVAAKSVPDWLTNW